MYRKVYDRILSKKSRVKCGSVTCYEVANIQWHASISSFYNDCVGSCSEKTLRILHYSYIQFVKDYRFIQG